MFRRHWAGVAGVTTALASACVGGELESEPDLSPLNFEVTSRIGGFEAEGPHAIGSVTAGTLLPNSDEFAIADGTAQDIRYFSLTGEHRRTVGGRGAGPGEFRSIRALDGVTGSALCVWETQGVRATAYDANGRLLSTSRADVSGLDALVPAFVAFGEGCSFVLRDQIEEMGLKDEPEGLRSDSVTFVLFDATGARGGGLATLPDAEKWFRNRDGSWGRVDLIFGEDLFGFMSGPNLWVGASGSLEWVRIDTRTGRSDTIAAHSAGRPASRDMSEFERRRRLAAVSPPPAGFAAVDGVDLSVMVAAVESAAILEVPARDRIPAYDRIFSGWDGAIWLREYPDPRSDEARWLLMSDSGALVGHVSLPRTTVVLDASFDRMLIASEDQLEAHVVQVLSRVR